MSLTFRPVPTRELAAWVDTGQQPLDAVGLGWHRQYPTAGTADAIGMLVMGPGGGAPPWGIWQMVRDATVIGDVGFHGPPDDDGAVEIGYQVVPAWRRRGIASRAVGLIMAETVRHGALSVSAEVVGDNLGSSRSLQRNGFDIVEEHGATTIWWRRLAPHDG